MKHRLLDSPPLNVVLVDPQIPPNAGNIARLCAAAGCHLIMTGDLGFELSDKSLKRAGLDYWQYVSWEYEPDAEAWLAGLPQRAIHLLTTHADVPYTHMPVCHGDYLLFGKETAGLPKEWLAKYRRQTYTIPMVEPGVRSLNLSSAAAIVVYDALRRIRPF